MNSTPDSTQTARQEYGRRQIVTDIVVLIAAALFDIGVASANSGSDIDPLGFVVWGVSLGALMRRRQQPLVVLAITASLLTAFALSTRLFGLWPALLGFGLLAFSPFHIAHSRLLHLDGLVSSFMFLAVIAFLVYLQERRTSILILSGIVLVVLPYFIRK